MGRARKNGIDDGPSASAVVSVDDLCERYPKQWMVMEVTERDEYTHPKAGKLLAHHERRSGISRAVIAALGRKQHIYVFAGYKSASHAEVSAHFNRMIEKTAESGRKR